MGPGLRIETQRNDFTVHIVDDDSRARAEHARTVLMLGYHAELYSTPEELLERPPKGGVILVRQRSSGTHVQELTQSLSKGGVSVPLIAAADAPNIDQVVAAMLAGAADFLEVPLEPARTARSLSGLATEADLRARVHRASVEARRRIDALSHRERQVLECIALGASNKMIARKLDISPRTVEIHRAHMMAKLNAKHAIAAVRMWVQSGLEGAEQSFSDSTAEPTAPRCG